MSEDFTITPSLTVLTTWQFLYHTLIKTDPTLYSNMLHIANVFLGGVAFLTKNMARWTN